MDDIVVMDVEMFRAEDMGDHWWVCCYLKNAERITWHVRRDVWKVVEHPHPDQVAYEHLAPGGNVQPATPASGGNSEQPSA